VKGRAFIVGTVALLWAGACAEQPVRDEELKVQAPFAQASVWADSLFVRLTAGTPIQAVVRVPIAPLVAGMTLDEAVAVAGKPVKTRADSSIGTFYSFGLGASGVELAHFDYHGGSGPVRKWVITATPQDNTTSALLSADMTALLAHAGSIRELTIHERERPHLQAFTARVHNDRLSGLEWFSITGVPEG